MKRPERLLLLALPLLVAGCSLFGAAPCEEDGDCLNDGECRANFCVPPADAPPRPDAGASVDAGARSDAGSPPVDAGAPLDAGARIDAGSPDAGGPFDGGAPVDAGAPPVDAGPVEWADPQLDQRLALTIQNPLNFPVLDVPVLIALPLEAAQAIQNPSHIRFYDESGTQLAYERESPGLMWLNPGEITANSSRRVFLYFDDLGGARPPPPVTQLWRRDLVVLHLTDEDNSVQPSQRLTVPGASLAPTDVTDGAIGPAKAFSADSALSFNLPQTSPLVTGGDLTVELWARFDAIGDLDAFDNGLVAIGDSVYPLWFSLDPDRHPLLFSGEFGGETRSTSPANPIGVNVGAWHHLALVRGPSSVRFFFDGADLGSLGYTELLLTPASSIFMLGNDPQGPQAQYGLEGALDEIRVSDTARDSNEVFARYTFGRGFTGYAFGAIEPQP